MAAIFYSYGNNSIFSKVGSSTAPVTLDVFGSLVNSGSLCIITQFGINTTETIQYFQTFDDLIHYYWFGKGLGSMSISGMLFMDCNGAMPGINNLLTAVGQKRGQEVTCVMGGISFVGILQECNITMVSEPETMATFNITMSMVDHTLPSPKPAAPSC